MMNNQEIITVYHKELKGLEGSGRGGTDRALWLKNYIRDLELQVREENRKIKLEKLNNATSIEQIRKITTE